MADLSRREMLKRVVVAGVAASLPGPATASAGGVQPPAEAFATLTADEGAALRAAVARLIPADERGPGALEAGAAVYIDRALAGPLAGSLAAYRGGLAALDRYAVSSRGARFAALDRAAQDALLRDMEAGVPTGFTPSGAAAFFNLLLAHTIEGTFSDPAHGGNVDFIGWRMIGYPGVRTQVTPDLQRMDRLPPSRQVSAYDFPAFRAARERRTRGR